MVLAFLWIIVASLLVYAVVSKSDSGSGPSPPPPPPTDLPPIPSGAVFLVLIGNDYTVCTPNTSFAPPDSGVSGDSFVAYGYTTPESYTVTTFNTTGFSGNCTVQSETPIVYNEWFIRIEGFENPDVHVIVSNTYSLQVLIDYYFSNYFENSLGRPTATSVTDTTLTIRSAAEINPGDDWEYTFYYGQEGEFLSIQASGSKIGDFITSDISNLVPGTTYYFVCEAYNSATDEDAYSEVSLGIQTTGDPPEAL